MSTATYALEVQLGASIKSNYYKNLNNAANSMQRLNSTASRVAAGITAAFAAVNITRTIEDAVETYSEFEQEMDTVASISGATAYQYDQMKEAALSAGSATSFTATEAASALEYMSLAGWDVNTSTTALMPVLRMAAATGAELGTTSDLVTDSMSALGLGVDDLESYMDKMIAANNNANATAEMLMTSMVKTGGASKTLGASLDDTITALGILANNGVKAEEAGTALNAILTRIATKSTALDEFKNIGVSIFDSNGSFIGLKETLEAVNNVMKDFSDEQKALSLSKIAGTQHYSQMTYLLDAFNEAGENGEKAWDALENKISSSDGALQRMYDTTTDNLQNAQAILESAKDDMKIRLVDVFSEDAKDFILWLAGELPKATETLVAFAEAHRGEFADALESAGKGIEKLWSTGVAVGKWLIGHRGAVVGSLTAIGTALTASKIASTGMSLVGMLTGLGAAGWSILGISAAAGVIVGIGNAIEQANEKAVAANLADHFGNISLSLSELDALARQIVGEESLNGVTTMLDAASTTADSLENISGIWSDLQKEHWKVKIGFDFNKEDSEKYASELESYINGIEQYAEDKGYEVHIAASLLFGAESTQDAEAGEFYAGIQEQISQYGNELHDYLYNETNGALLDGIIDIDEDKIVQEYLTKINSITNAISEAESQAKFDTMTLKYNGADLTPESFTQLQEDIANYVNESAEGAQSAYESAMSEYHARLALDDGYTQENFDADSSKAWEAYQKFQGDAAIRGIDYMLDTLNEAYPNLQGALDQYQSDMNNILKEYSNSDDTDLQKEWKDSPNAVMQQMSEQTYDAIKNNPISADRDAIAELLETMQPTVQEVGEVVQAYMEAGQELPEEIAEFKEYWQTLSDLINGDEGQAQIDLVNTMSTDGAFKGFLENMGLEIDETHLAVQKKIDEAYKDGFDVTTDMRMHFDVLFQNGTDTTNATKSSSFVLKNDSTKKSTLSTNYAYKIPVAHNAQGGIYSKPILTTFAEEGAEAAVPLDGSNRAKSIWMQAGQMLGMLGGEETRDKAIYNALSKGNSGNNASSSIVSGGGINIVCSPNITIQGNASQEDVQNALSIGMDEFRTMFNEIMAQNKRVAFDS